jgi:hypothetical protein
VEVPDRKDYSQLYQKLVELYKQVHANKQDIVELKEELSTIQGTLERAENAAIKRAYNPAASGRSDRL